MLKRRLIPVLNILNGHIVRSESFNIHQKIGNIINQAERYSEWEVDELVYLDISRSNEYDMGRDDHKIHSYSNIVEVIERVSSVCFMPLAFGGGIRTMSDVDSYIRNGADKIVINTQALNKPEFVTEIAKKYGKQAVVVSIDYRINTGIPMVYKNFGQVPINISLYDWSKEMEARGAGEIFINCIDRDGQGNGFDIKTINSVSKLISIPLIVCGGAGSLEDFHEVFTETDASAIAAGNFFHFTERAYPNVKKMLKKDNINVR